MSIVAAGESEYANFFFETVNTHQEGPEVFDVLQRSHVREGSSVANIFRWLIVYYSLEYHRNRTGSSRYHCVWK